MSKNKDSSNSKKDEVDDYLSSYLNMKSPLIGQLEFDASVLPPPVDPKFIDYELNDEIVKYKLTSLEFSERLSNFSDFNQGISDVLLHATSFTGCGIENQYLMEYIESSLLDSMYKNDKSGDNVYESIRNDLVDLVKYFESIKMGNIVNKTKESLPNYMQNLVSTNLDPTLLHNGKINMFKDLESRSAFKRSVQSSQHSTPSTQDRLVDGLSGSQIDSNILSKPSQSTTSPLTIATNTLKDWDSMTIDERIDAYLAALDKTFVGPDELVHPTNKFIKKAKVYNIVPNQRLWNNKYIQVGIDGVSVTSDSNSKLEVDGVLRLAKETQTQRFFEYYKPYESNDSSPRSPANSDHLKAETHKESKKVKKEESIDDLFAEDHEMDDPDKMALDSKEKESDPSSGDEGQLFKFIRQYTSAVSKSSGTENYFLLSLPKDVSDKLHMVKPTNKNQPGKASLKGNRMVKIIEDDFSNEEPLTEVQVVPIRGQKMVFSKAGVNKRPDIRIAYVTQ